MSDKKVYYTFLGILVTVSIIVNSAHTILPTMDYDEYFVDKYKNIHNNNCPYKDVPWFTKKHKKYDFMKKLDQQFCNECFLYEEIMKLLILHEINLDNEILRLEWAGADKEYIDKKLEQYEI